MSSVSAIKAGRAFVELFADSTKLEKGLHQSEKMLEKWGEKVGEIGKEMMKLGAEGAAVLTETVYAFAEMGSAIGHAAARAQMLPESFSALSYAAKMADVDVGELEGSLRKMQRGIATAAESGDKMDNAYHQMGLSAKQLMAMKPEDQFLTLAERISQIHNPTQKAQAVIDAFGRSGTALLPMFEKGAGGIRTFMEEAKRLGLVIGGETVEKAEKLDKTFLRLRETVKMLNMRIGEQLAPIFQGLADKLVLAVAGVTRWVRANGDTIQQALLVSGALLAAGAGLTAVGVAMTVTASLIGSALTIWGALSFAVGAVGVAFTAILNPIGLVVIAWAALGAVALYQSGAMGRAASWIGEKWKILKGDFDKVMGGISDALATGDIAAAVNILWLGLQLEWTRGTNAIKGAWDWLWTRIKEVAVTTGATIVSAVAKVWDWLSTGMDTVIKYMMHRWVNFSSFLGDLWDEISANVKKSMVSIKSLHSKVNIGVEYQKIDAQTEANRNLRENNRNSDLVGYGQAAANQAAERKRTLDQIAAYGAAYYTKAEGQHSAYMDKLAADLKKAQGDLDSAVKKARENKLIDAALDKFFSEGEGGKKFNMPNVPGAIREAENFGRVGFAGSGALALTGNTGPKRLEEAAVQTAKNTAEMLKKMEADEFT